MANSNPRNAVIDRKRPVSEENAQSRPAAAGRPAAQASESVVLLEKRRRNAALETASSEGESRRAKEIGDQIGKELRELYADLVAQPVPERFLDLLNELEAKTISPPTTPKSPGER